MSGEERCEKITNGKNCVLRWAHDGECRPPAPKPLERRIRFAQAYDNRHTLGGGRHGVELHVGVLDPNRHEAAILVVFTGWFPHHDPAGRGPREVIHGPIAVSATICAPSLAPAYYLETNGNVVYPARGPCWLHGVVCADLYHAGMHETDLVLEALIRGGDDGCYAKLEEMLKLYRESEERRKETK